MIGCLSFVLTFAALIATYGTGLFVPAIVVAIATFWSVGVIANYRDDPRNAPNLAAVVSMAAFALSVVLLIAGLVTRIGASDDDDDRASYNGVYDDFGDPEDERYEAEPEPEPEPGRSRQDEPGVDLGDSGSGEVSWDQAVNYVGENMMVCGPVRSIREDSGDTFINVGRDYPDPRRFTIVIWNQTGLVADDPTGDVCIEGVIANYRGTAQVTTNDYEDLKVPK